MLLFKGLLLVVSVISISITYDLTYIQNKPSNQLHQIEDLKREIESLKVRNMVYLESWRSAQAESLRLRLEIQKMVEICEAQDRVLQDLRHNDEIAEEARRMVYDDYASLKENATNNRIE